MPEEKVDVTFQTDVQSRDAHDGIARSMERDRGHRGKEAIAQYVVWNEMQEEKIKRGVAQADAGEFAPDDEVDAFFNEWAGTDDSDVHREEKRAL